MHWIVFEKIHLSSIIDVPVCTITINASNKIYAWPLYLYGNRKKENEYIVCQFLYCDTPEWKFNLWRSASLSVSC
jgi:hypothetical protein